MKSRLKKVVIPVREEETAVYGHFCYISSDLFARLQAHYPKGYPFSMWCKEHIGGWLSEDFGVELSLDTMNELYIARQTIKNLYYAEHNLTEEHSRTVFVQGIVKDWLTKHIEKYIKEVE